MAEGLDEGDDGVLVEHGHGHAQVGQMADPAFRSVDVVVEEHVARPHGLQREVADDGLHEGGIRASRELAAAAVVDAGAEVARLADHGRARRALDRRLDLRLDGGEGALDDLEDDRIDRMVAHDAPPVRMRFAKRSISSRWPG
jgi:hypothetical protein